MTWRALAVCLCMLGATIIGLAAGLAWSPIRTEHELHATLGSLKQCNADLDQLTEWKRSAEAQRLILVLSQLEAERAASDVMAADYRSCKAGLKLFTIESASSEGLFQ